MLAGGMATGRSSSIIWKPVAAFPEGRFDLITSFQVIEHVVDVPAISRK